MCIFSPKVWHYGKEATKIQGLYAHTRLAGYQVEITSYVQKKAFASLKITKEIHNRRFTKHENKIEKPRTILRPHLYKNLWRSEGAGGRDNEDNVGGRERRKEEGGKGEKQL